MLEITDVSKCFRGTAAIQNVSFRIEPGKIVGYLDPNGSGKPATVKIVTGGWSQAA